MCRGCHCQLPSLPSAKKSEVSAEQIQNNKFCETTTYLVWKLNIISTHMLKVKKKKKKESLFPWIILHLDRLGEGSGAVVKIYYYKEVNTQSQFH